MILELIKKFGKDKINTLTKFPSILTLHDLVKNKLTDTFTTIIDEPMFATEKIDGQNMRLLYYGDERLIGNRDNLFHFSSKDFNHIPKEFFSMIDSVKPFYQKPKWNNFKYPTDKFTVIYGELFGGTIGNQAKNYGDKLDFRVFDVAVFSDLSILSQDISKISSWREHSKNSSLREELEYGQNFLSNNELEQFIIDSPFSLVPQVEFELGDMSHKTILDNLNKFIPTTNVALSDSALKRPEGLVLTNESRTKRVKLRFEDYLKVVK